MIQLLKKYIRIREKIFLYLLKEPFFGINGCSALYYFTLGNFESAAGDSNLCDS